MQIINGSGVFTQYVTDSYYANLTAGGLVPNPIAVIGFNGDQLLFVILTLMLILQTMSTLCLLYLVVKSRRRDNPGRMD